MKKVLSLVFIMAMVSSMICLSGCDTGIKIVKADPVQLIDLSDTCITAQESGDYTYHPNEETIEIDTEDSAIYFNNLITVFVEDSLSSDEVQELLDHVDGQLVGITRNGVNSLEIKVAESSLSELKDKADSLYDFDCVLFSDYDFPITTSDVALTNDPWIAGDTPIENRGNEEHPYGNDWWAEAVGAYTAWDLCEGITEKAKVAVVDSGVNLNHEELSGVSDYSLYPNTPSSHGTAVAGIIAAGSDNEVGIRGLASDNSEVVSVDIEVDGKDYWSNNEWISIFSSLVESGNKIINFSQGMYFYSQEFFDSHSYTIITEKDPFERNLFEKYFDWYTSAYAGESHYDAYINLSGIRAKQYGSLCIRLIANLIINGYEEFIFVQAAGNGYDNSTAEPGCDTFYSGFFDAMNKEIFYFTTTEKTLQKLKDKGINYDTIAGHKIVVAATGKPDSDGNYSLTSWSSYGDNVDICAPGVDIYHCPSFDDENASNNSFYETFLGTSAAAPIVSAGVALTWAAFPDASAATIKDLMIDNATVYADGATAGDNRTYPMLNIGKSVEAALPDRIVLNPTEDEETKIEADFGEKSVYSDIISAYRVAAENNFFNGDQEACGDINFELWLSAYRGSDLVYALVDLCNDGEPELIIAALNSKYSGGYQIYDIWGQKSGIPYRIFDIGSMGYRSIYSITNDNQLMLTYSDTETWGEPGYEYPVQICYNRIYELTPYSSNAVFTEGFKREVIGEEEFYCYYVDESGNEINPFFDDDYSYFQSKTGVAWNEINYNPGRSMEWTAIYENIKSN